MIRAAKKIVPQDKQKEKGSTLLSMLICMIQCHVTSCVRLYESTLKKGWWQPSVACHNNTDPILYVASWLFHLSTKGVFECTRRQGAYHTDTVSLSLCHVMTQPGVISFCLSPRMTVCYEPPCKKQRMAAPFRGTLNTGRPLSAEKTAKRSQLWY